MLKQHYRNLEKDIESLSMGKIINNNEVIVTENMQSNNDNDVNGQEDKILTKKIIQKNKDIKFDIERIIDDFVFMCFFIGNDFVPNIPHLDIADGSLSLMMNVYREMLPHKLGGYLTDKNAIHLGRVELFMQEIGRREPLYFQQRATDDKEPSYATDSYREHYYQVHYFYIIFILAFISYCNICIYCRSKYSQNLDLVQQIKRHYVILSLHI